MVNASCHIKSGFELKSRWWKAHARTTGAMAVVASYAVIRTVSLNTFFFFNVVALGAVQV